MIVLLLVVVKNLNSMSTSRRLL